MERLGRCIDRRYRLASRFASLQADDPYSLAGKVDLGIGCLGGEPGVLGDALAFEAALDQVACGADDGVPIGDDPGGARFDNQYGIVGFSWRLRSGCGADARRCEIATSLRFSQ